MLSRLEIRGGNIYRGLVGVYIDGLWGYYQKGAGIRAKAHSLSQIILSKYVEQSRELKEEGTGRKGIF